MNMTVKKGPVSSCAVLDKQAAKGSYVPDLSSFMSLCDANYVKFMKLLPDFDQADSRCFGLSRNEHELGLITIEIVERARYTTTVDVKQGNDGDFLPGTRMQVRLYHDASMAEVLSYQGIEGLKASYVYPNKDMFQRDEKALCNEFLADWLSYCLKFGYHLMELDHSGAIQDATELKNIEENISYKC